MAWSINMMSLCCLVVGLFVLFSILQNQMLNKQRDFALQKIMGFSEARILKITSFEFLIMITMAIVLGNGGGSALTYFISEFILNLPYKVDFQYIIQLNGSILFLGLIVLVLTFKSYANKKVNELLLK